MLGVLLYNTAVFGLLTWKYINASLFETPSSSKIDEFPGNLRLAALIDQHRETHQGLDRLGKTNISSQIVQLIQLSNGRFLKRADEEDDGWYVQPAIDWFILPA